MAFGDGGKAEDREGALRVVAREPLGRWSLVLVAVGFAGYATWRFVQGVLDRDHEGDGPSALAKRAGQIGKGVLYTALAAITVSIVVDAGGSGGANEDKWTGRILELPAGRLLVGGIGLAIVGAGVFNAYRSVTTKFRKDLQTHRMGEAEDRVYTVIGVAGHAARGVVFSMIGLFLLRAAWQYDPKEAIGLDGALRKLAQQEYGPWWLGTVAAGMLAYALFCLVQARYRDV